MGTVIYLFISYQIHIKTRKNI